MYVCYRTELLNTYYILDWNVYNSFSKQDEKFLRYTEVPPIIYRIFVEQYRKIETICFYRTIALIIKLFCFFFLIGLLVCKFISFIRLRFTGCKFSDLIFRLRFFGCIFIFFFAAYFQLWFFNCDFFAAVIWLLFIFFNKTDKKHPKTQLI